MGLFIASVDYWQNISCGNNNVGPSMAKRTVEFFTLEYILRYC